MLEAVRQRPAQTSRDAPARRYPGAALVADILVRLYGCLQGFSWIVSPHVSTSTPGTCGGLGYRDSGDGVDLSPECTRGHRDHPKTEKGDSPHHQDFRLCSKCEWMDDSTHPASMVAGVPKAVPLAGEQNAAASRPANLRQLVLGDTRREVVERQG